MDKALEAFSPLVDQKPASSAAETAELIKNFINYVKGPINSKNFDLKQATEIWTGFTKVVKVDDSEIIQDSVLNLTAQEAHRFLMTLIDPAYTTVDMRKSIGPAKMGIWVDALIARANVSQDEMIDKSIVKAMNKVIREKEILMSALLNSVYE